MTLSITPLSCDDEITRGHDLVELILRSLERAGETLCDFDLLVVTSKVVAKAEGHVVAFDGTDEHKLAIIDSQTRRVLRRRGTLRITETHHGFVNANAGVDLSNTLDGTAVLLPRDPDRSARRLRSELRRRHDVELAVLVSDTFGRAWRHGVVDVALGVAGLRPIADLRGTRDRNGRTLEATEVCVADEVAAAANLAMPKAAGTPFALVRGLDHSLFGEGSIRDHVVRRADDDLFR